MKTPENRINELYKELVPRTGKADTVAGEIIRAIAILARSFEEEGYQIGIEGGKLVCNPAARYLQKVGDKEIDRTIKYLWGRKGKGEYRYILSELYLEVVEFLDAHPELKTTPNEINLLHLELREDWDEED